MKREIATFAFLAIIASMIFGSLPNHAFADSQSESLIQIALQARDQLRIQLSKSADSSDELKDLLIKGSAEIELLSEAAKADDVSKAREHFLSAMKIFREISQKITEKQTQEIATAQSQAPISNELERLELYVDRLKEIVINNKIDVNFSKIETMIDNAKTAQRQGNYDDVVLDEIKQETIVIQKSIKEKTSSSTTQKAKSFAQKHLDELDSLISQAREIGVSESTIKRLEEARGNLVEESDVAQIISQVKHIISVTKEFEDTKSERIKSRINQLESKMDRLSNYSGEADYDFDRVKMMMSELKNLVNDKKLDEAIRVLNSLNSLLNEIETSQSSQIESSTTENEVPANSLDESKIERIKVKIQRLEDQLNRLEEQLEEDYAKRWLNSAKSQLENSKLHVDDSPDEVLQIIMKVEQIIERIQKTIQ